MRTALALAVLCGGGCADPGGAHDPLRYLQVGVDPAREADEVAEHLQHRGFALVRRIDGRSFVALGLEHPLDGRTAVRIVTRRGIAAAVDAPDDEPVDVASVALHAPPTPTHDLDDDGREEVLIQLRPRQSGRTCVGIVRVLEDGHVVEVGVPITALDVLEPIRERACIEDVRDVGATAGPEALVALRYEELAREQLPVIHVPFGARQGDWRPADPDAYRAYFQQQRRRRQRELEQARADGDAETVYRLAIELSALAHHGGEPESDALGAFDAALEGASLTPGQARSASDARGWLETGWSGERAGAEAE